MSSKFMAKRRRYTILVRNDEETSVEEAFDTIRKAFGYDITQTATAVEEIERKGETTCREYTDVEKAEFALQMLLKAGMDAELLQI